MPPRTTVVKIRKRTWKPRLGSNVPCTTANMIAADAGERAGEHPDIACRCDRHRCRRSPRGRDCRRRRASTCRAVVRARKQATAGATTSVIATATAWPGEMRKRPRSKTTVWSMSSLRMRGPATRKDDVAHHQAEPDRDQRGRDQAAPRSGCSTAKCKRDARGAPSRASRQAPR